MIRLHLRFDSEVSILFSCRRARKIQHFCRGVDMCAMDHRETFPPHLKSPYLSITSSFVKNISKYKVLSAYNCVSETKNVNAKYFSIHLLFKTFFGFIPMLNLCHLFMIKHGNFQLRMLRMQLDTNMSFL